MSQNSSPRLTVRRVRPEEWRELRDLRLLALKTDPMAFDWTLDEEMALPEARWRDKAEEGAGASRSSTWVAVDQGGQLAGMVTVYEDNSLPNISGMWLNPAYRGRGEAGRLLDAALGWAREVFPDRPIRLELNPTQIPAVTLYTSRGFRFTGASRAPRVPRAGVTEAHEMLLAVTIGTKT